MNIKKVIVNSFLFFPNWFNNILLILNHDAKYAVSTVLKNPSGTVLYEIRERDAGHWYIGDLCTCAFWCKLDSIFNVHIVSSH